MRFNRFILSVPMILDTLLPVVFYAAFFGAIAFGITAGIHVANHHFGGG